jgi:glutamyl-tRNA(Gln) amidotransferase subunit D
MDYNALLKKFKAKEGSQVKVFTTKGDFEGTILPSTKKNVLALKTKQGYNAGFDVKDVKQIKLLGGGKGVGKPKVAKMVKYPEKPAISILHTGGTIASRVNYTTGGVIASFTSEDIITMFPEITDIANIEAKLVSNIMSEDMLFKDYQTLARAVEKEVKRGVAGVIIGHGTDTLAYTAAALAFMLEDVPIPVIIVGAQRSSDRGSSDAAMNLVCACEFIAKSDFAGVGICMHENMQDDYCVILPPTKTRKMHTSRRDAFKAINSKAIARIDYKTREIDFLQKNYPKKSKSKKLTVKDKFEERVGVLRTHPNMFAETIKLFSQKKYKGLILEGTGIGQAPTNVKENLPNYKALQDFIKEGGIILLTSQCIYGRVHENIYTNCRRLKEIGVIFGDDMITETAFLKLAWLLGNYPRKDVPKLLKENLRGEITSCSKIEGFDTPGE